MTKKSLLYLYEHINSILLINVGQRKRNKERKIEPINVLIPTRLNGLISVVFIIMGMVPQEIAKTVIAA